MNESLKKELLKRTIIFLTLSTMVVAICASHGIRAGERTTRCIDQMVAEGHLIGKFWRIIGIEHDRIMVTKYQRIIALAWSSGKDIGIGDRLSFIATPEGKGHGDDKLWHPDKIHFHGNSILKYYFSILAVVVAAIMGMRHFKFSLSSFSLALRKGRESDA